MRLRAHFRPLRPHVVLDLLRSFKRRQELCICGKAQSAQQMATRKLVVALGEARHSTSDYREKGTTSQPPWVRLLRRPRIRRGDVTLLLCTRKRKLVPGADAKRNSSPLSTAVVGALRLPTIFLWGGKTRCAFDCNTLYVDKCS